MAALIQKWRDLRLDRKVSTITVFILSLFFIHSLSSLNAIQSMLNNVENQAFVAADLQYLTLEAERNFRKAAVLQRDFFYEYPQIGLEQAQKNYALPAVQLMNEAIAISQGIDDKISNSGLEQFDEQVAETYSDAAKNYQNIFIQAAAFITILTDPTTGLVPQLDQTAVDIGIHLADEPALISVLDEVRILEREYFIVRDPGSMLYVTDKVSVLQTAIQSEPSLTPADRNRALSLIDIYIAITEEIVAIDAEIAKLQFKFDAQQIALDQTSANLNEYATITFGQAQKNIRSVYFNMVWMNIILVAIGVGLSYAVIIVLRRSVTDKVVQLTDVIRRFHTGHYKVSAQVTSADEIGRLAEGFNEMAGRIAHLLSNLEERNIEVNQANQNLNIELRERKKIQQSLEDQKIQLQSFASDLQRSNRELEEFAYIVSHDLRAPLRGISTLITWLREDYINHFDEMGVEMLELLIQRVYRLDALIHGILEFSRVGRDEQKAELVDTKRLIAQTVDTLSPPDHIEITILNEMPLIKAEPIRLGQLFQNIIDNSIKYNDKEQGEIQIGCRSTGDFWEFTIADNGPGIDPKYHQKIFQIFQTLETDESVQSTGVGLSLVKKIVTLYGGTITVESTVGEGTQFIFTLPKLDVSQSQEVNPLDSDRDLEPLISVF